MLSSCRLTLLEDADGGRGLGGHEALGTLGARDGHHVQDGQAEPLRCTGGGKGVYFLVSQLASARFIADGTDDVWSHNENPGGGQDSRNLSNSPYILTL